MTSILKETEYVTTGVEIALAEKLLTHIAGQTKTIENQLTIMINEKITRNSQNFNHEVNNTLMLLKENDI